VPLGSAKGAPTEPGPPRNRGTCGLAKPILGSEAASERHGGVARDGPTTWRPSLPASPGAYCAIDSGKRLRGSAQNWEVNPRGGECGADPFESDVASDFAGATAKPARGDCRTHQEYSVRKNISQGLCTFTCSRRPEKMQAREKMCMFI